MASLKQIEAARTNGARSKGPVTPEGKARVSQNAIKHGIYTQTVVLENEDENLYSIWRDNHLAEWSPATDTEHNLVVDIVDARWRLRRLSVLETKALDFEVSRMREQIDDAFEKIDEGTRTVIGLTSLLSLNRTWEVIQTSIRTQHRIIDRAIAQLLKLGKVRRPANDPDDHDGGSEGRASTNVGTATTTSAGGTAGMNAEAVQPGNEWNDESRKGSNAIVSKPEQSLGSHQRQSSEPASDTSSPVVRSQWQVRETTPAPSPTISESKPEPVALSYPPRPRAVFNPTLESRRRAA